MTRARIGVKTIEASAFTLWPRSLPNRTAQTHRGRKQGPTALRRKARRPRAGPRFGLSCPRGQL
jgi:hypothetical protein